MAHNSHLADIIIADGDSTDGSTEHSFFKGKRGSHIIGQ
jgi:hypothetical protein